MKNLYVLRDINNAPLKIGENYLLGGEVITSVDHKIRTRTSWFKEMTLVYRTSDGDERELIVKAEYLDSGMFGWPFFRAPIRKARVRSESGRQLVYSSK